MARYLQKIALLGRERWIGWEVDGVGTEVSGLILADELTDDEIRARGVKEFRPMTFEAFLGMNAEAGETSGFLPDEDIEFRLDALQVGLERIRGRGESDVPRELFTRMFGGDAGQLDHPRVQRRLRGWQDEGVVEFVGREDCYVRIVGRFHVA